MTGEDDLEAAVGAVLALVAERGPAADEARRPDPEVMGALARSGLLRLLVPRALGGLEVPMVRFVGLIEQVARVHPSTAWTFMTCNEEAGIATAYLDPASIADLYANAPHTIVAGSGVPKGRARFDGGGCWRVDGRWDFVSGCTASDRLILSCLVADRRPAELCFVLVPTGEVVIDDTWDTVGLRGTGSHDVVLDDHPVPDRWSGVTEPNQASGPDATFYRLPHRLRFPFPKVGVAVGTARAAIDEFTALAEGKRPLFNRGTLRERPTAQVAVAEAEALVASGRAWALEMLEELWATVAAGGEVSEHLHARCRLACSHAVSSAIAAVDLLVAEAGSTANFRSSALAGLAADVRAVAGHFTVAAYQKATAGRHLLGLERIDPQF
ncbi:MAG: acyl-CoA dehydrogenase family protein [Acidimicrobiales bacterium]